MAVRIGAAHAGLAGEYGVGAGGGVLGDIGRAAHPGLGDRERAGGHQRAQPREDPAIDLQRAQIAGVDPDQRGTDGGGPLELGLVVHLDQRRSSRTRAICAAQVSQQRLLERRDDQQHQVGAVGPGFGHLIRA